jgi:ABC-type bacteriocin/lantibiotic exporter with double-glycine peptidase domain
MIEPIPIAIVQKTAKLLKVTFDPFQVREHYKTIHADTVTSVDEIVRHMQELVRFTGISFLENRLSVESLEELIESKCLPLLVFVKDPEPKPFLITGYKKGGGAEGYVFEREGVRDASYSFKTLEYDLYKEGDSGWTVSYLRDMEQSVLVLSPMAINPLVSSPEDNRGPAKPWKRFWHLILSERRNISFIYVYALIAGLLSLTTPLGVQAIIGLISGGLILEPIIVLIAFVILATLIGGILQVMQARVVEYVQQRIFARGAFEFAYRIPRIDLEAISRNYAPELMNRFFDILTIQKGFAKILTDMLSSVLQILFGLVLLTFYHPFFVFFGIFLTFVLILIFRFTGAKGLSTSIMESKYKYKVVQWLEEIARTLPTFKLAGFTNISLQRMDSHVSYYLKKREAHFQILMTQYFSIVFFKTIITGGILIIGAYLVINRQITLGQFVASDIVIITVLNAVEKIIQNLDQVYDVLTAVDKIGQVTDLPLDSSKGILLAHTDKTHGFDIKVRNLRYKYPHAQEYAIRNINVDIRSGEKIGIIGTEASGKTTFMHVISGLLHSYEGIVAYNGISLRDLNVTSLRDDIGDILSVEDIFDGTLQDNITVGKSEVSFEDLMWAIEKVGLLDFVHSLPDGLQTHLTTGGKDIPRSVMQKIILARSIAEHPRLIVIDDFFFNTDLSMQREMAGFLFDPASKWTVLAVTQSPIILSKCDRIFFFDKGTIVEELRYEDLFASPHLQPYVIHTATKQGPAAISPATNATE